MTTARPSPKPTQPLHRRGTTLRCPTCGRTVVVTVPVAVARCTDSGRHRSVEMRPDE